MDYEKKDFRKIYEDLVKSDWFKRAYHNKSLGECPFDIPELAESEDEKMYARVTERYTRFEKYYLRALGETEANKVLKQCEEEELWIKNLLEKQKDLDKMIVVSPEVWDKAISDAFENGRKEGEKQKVNVKDKVRVVSWRSPDDCSDIPEGHYVVIAYNPGVFGLGYIANGKVVAAPNNKPQAIFYIPNADESVVIEQKPEWGEEDEANFAWFDKFFRAESVVAGGKDIPQDKYLWFKSLRPQPKQEWSDKDDHILNNIYDFVAENTIDINRAPCAKECLDWLKSLRPSWKPSEEQMEALKYVTKQWEDGKGVACPSSFKYYEITELYEQLKKLGVREEPEYYQHFDPDC